MSVQVVILAAGLGARLGRAIPKAIAPLRDGRTILGQQVDNVRSAYGPDVSVLVVVGFKHDLIMEAAPDLLYAYNELFDQTNTSKSLLKALSVTGVAPVLWMNGDVVFHPEVLRRVQDLIDRDRSFVCVNTAAVGAEEVKYTVDGDGFVAQLSKTVEAPLGEAIGINFVASTDKATLMRHLVAVDNQDYFERGIELAIEHDAMRVTPVDISDLYAVEVDFESDLVRANEYVAPE